MAKVGIQISEDSALLAEQAAVQARRIASCFFVGALPVLASTITAPRLGLMSPTKASISALAARVLAMVLRHHTSGLWLGGERFLLKTRKRLPFLRDKEPPQEAEEQCQADDLAGPSHYGALVLNFALPVTHGYLASPATMPTMKSIATMAVPM